MLVIQRRGHTTKNGSSVDAMLGDTNCLCEGEVDDCEVLRYAVQPPSSWTTPSSRPADSPRGEVVQFQDFTFGWHTMQVTEPTQSTLRQGDRDWALFSLLSIIPIANRIINSQPLFRADFPLPVSFRKKLPISLCFSARSTLPHLSLNLG